MNDFEKILEIAEANQGILKTEMVVAAGIRKERLKDLLDQGEIKRIGRGFYKVAGAKNDSFYEIQKRVPKTIFSYETAAYLWGMTDQVGESYNCTVPRGYNTSKLKLNHQMKYHYVLQELYEIGLTTKESPDGNEILLYDRERTICDFIRHRNRMNPQVYSEVLNYYFKSNEKDIRKLAKYGKLFHVSQEIELYIDVLYM